MFGAQVARGDQLIARHDAAAGKALADRARDGFAAEIASAHAGDKDAICRKVKEAVPSAKPCRTAPPGMGDSHIRTDLKAGDIASWGWDRMCAVANSLGQDVVVTLRPRTA